MRPIRPRTWRLTLLSALITLTMSSEAFGQRIVLVRPRTSDPVILEAFNRFRGELHQHDFETIVVDSDTGGEVSPDALAQAAERSGAVASVSFVRTKGTTTADIWLSDRVTGKTSIRTISTETAGEAPSVLAIRAVDLLRTSLRETDSNTPPPPDIVGARPERAPASVRAWAAAPKADIPSSSLELRVEGAAILSRVGVGWGAAFQLSYRHDRWRAGLGFAGPLSGASLSNSAGSAQIRQQLGWVEAGFSPWMTRHFALEGTVAAGLHHLSVNGTVAPPWIGQSDQLWALAIAPGVGATLRLSRQASIGLSIRPLFVTPRPFVRVADERKALGPPMFLATLGLRVGF